jgi:uncharacterized protein (TIGR01370 family)
MVGWVKKIASRARAMRPNAIIIPQNGAALLEHGDFAHSITAMGLEDVFSDGNTEQSAEHIDGALGHVKSAGCAGLVIEYPTDPARIEKIRAKAQAAGLTWLFTDRNLQTLGQSGR